MYEARDSQQGYEITTRIAERSDKMVANPDHRVGTGNPLTSEQGVNMTQHPVQHHVGAGDLSTSEQGDQHHVGVGDHHSTSEQGDNMIRTADQSDERRLTMDLQTHPAAELFPELTGLELEELKEDIRQHGQREPITLLDRCYHGVYELEQALHQVKISDSTAAEIAELPHKEQRLRLEALLGQKIKRGRRAPDFKHLDATTQKILDEHKITCDSDAMWELYRIGGTYVTEKQRLTLRHVVAKMVVNGQAYDVKEAKNMILLEWLASKLSDVGTDAGLTNGSN
jgi:hypothetical protein